MTATATEEAAETDTASQGFRPRHTALVIGFGFATLTALSNAAELIFDFKDTTKDTRPYFINIPGAMKLAFYLTMVVVIAYGGWMFSQRMRNWERGAPDKRATTTKNIKQRVESLRAGLYMQTLMRDPAAGIMHSLMYFSFLILLAITTIGEVNLQLPTAAKFLHGRNYEAFACVADVAGILFLIGVFWAIIRRYVQRPYRIRIKSKPEHAMILGVMAAIGVTGFFTEALRIAIVGMPSYEKWSVLGYPLAKIVQGASWIHGGQQVAWALHILSFVAFLILLPTTMLRHMFTAPINMYLKDRDRPKGAMRAMPNLMETELESFGASTVDAGGGGGKAGATGAARPQVTRR